MRDDDNGWCGFAGSGLAGCSLSIVCARQRMYRRESAPACISEPHGFLKIGAL